MAKYKDCISTLLPQAARLHRTRAAYALSDIGLYPGQETVLKLLLKKKALSMTALAERLDVKPPTVTKMISRLEAQQLVERWKKTNSRVLKIKLTKLGKERAREIDKIWKRLDKETLKGFGSKDKARIKKLLKAISKTLSKIPSKTLKPANDESDMPAIEALGPSDLKMSA